MKRFDGKTAWWVWFLFIVYNLIPAFIMVHDWVDVYDDYFVFYYGFLKFVVKFENVVSVQKTRNPISTTANSLDRICVQTKKKNIYLALYKNDEFIEFINSKISQKQNSK